MAGTVGASVSAGSSVFSVVNVTASDLTDSFFSASTAVTVTVYSVSSVSPVRSYSVPVTSSSFTFVSFTYTLYPTTPTLSLASSHATFAVVSVTSEVLTFAGTVGASVSFGSSVFNVVKVAASDLTDSFSDVSTAVTITVYSVSSVSPVRS